jgi:hypothetical protein
MNDQQKRGLRHVLAEYRPTEFHRGDFVGAYAEAHAIVRAAHPSIWVVIHPPLTRKLRAFCQADEQRPALGYIAGRAWMT